MIASKDISVVVQGKIEPKYTGKCLKSIRKHLPKAEIILSTWKNEPIQNLNYDVLILNKDPGAYVFTSDVKPQNQNRQIVSTLNGIKKASRKYVLKLRSDIRLNGTKFLSYFAKYQKRNAQCKILQERVLINSLYTREPLTKNKPFLFHPSDWIMFGMKEDLLNIWDIPLAQEPQTSEYFKNNPDMPHVEGFYTRWHAEQYIWMSFLKKNGVDLQFDNYMSYSPELTELSELSIVNNTLLLEYKKQFDIVCQKYPQQFGDSEIAHPLNWLINYQKYCDHSFVIPKSWCDLLAFNPKYRKFKRHIAKLFSKLSVREIVPSISYFIQFCISFIFYAYQYNNKINRLNKNARK